MANKDYTTQAGKNESQKSYKSGGQGDFITATDDDISGFGYIISGGGGDDTIFGSDYAGPGDGTGDPKTESGDLLIGGSGSDFIVGGGGDDWIYGGKVNGSDGAKGKDAVAFNTLFGDVQGNFSNFAGGNDVITGGDDSTNVMYGDVFSANPNFTFVGGNDMLFGGDDAVNANISGPYLLMVGNLMVGDSFRGGTPETPLVNPVGGDDILVSGENSDDLMIGDFGADVVATGMDGGMDTFVFGANNGADVIADFRSADGDKINLFDTELTGFGDLDTGANPLAPTPDGTLDASDAFVSIIDGSTVIDLGAAAGGAADINLVTVQGVTGLMTGDFDFADWMMA